MRQHADAGVACRPGQARDRGGNVVGAGGDTLDQFVEFAIGEAGAFDHARRFCGLVELATIEVHVVVESEQVDPAVGEHCADFAFRIEIVGLVPQMEAGVGRKLRPQRFDALKQFLALSPLRKPGSQDQVVA